MTTPIPLQDYQRYGRQMILDGFGLPGQIKLHQSSVVVVGAGGLGCPALQYLGAAGIGRLGIIDHDRVELSNLQRQILHNEDTVGMYKAESAALALKRTNSGLDVDVMTVALTADNALSLLRPYDIILDCTDNAATRYLLSDAAVALKNLLSAEQPKSLRASSACTTLDRPDHATVACIQPPPPQDAMGSCEELGILGVVTGIIGNMQALETIKSFWAPMVHQTPSMLLFSALGSPPFRTIKLRQKKATCTACSDPSNALSSITNTNYVQFCGGPVPDWVNEGRVPGDIGYRIQPQALHDLLSSQNPLKLIDVRPRTEYGICSLPGSENIPLKELLVKPENYAPSGSDTDVYVVCRLGNDSQIAAEALRRVKNDVIVKDVIGGLRAWTHQVDSEFPLY